MGSQISIRGAAPLYVAQLINYLSPILILPVLARNLGVESFGFLVFYQAVATYVLVASEYGYAFTGPRDVAKAPGQMRRAYLLSTITAAKIYLAVSSGAFVAIFVWWLAPVHLALVLVCLLQPLGQAAFPGWYLQGREKFLGLAACQAVGRILGFIAAISLVRGSDDLLWAALASSAAPAVSAVAAWIYIKRSDPTNIWHPRWRAICRSLYRGRHMFQANVAGSLYLNTGVVIVGWLAGGAVVGAYGLAVRLISASSTLVSPISQIALPRVAAMCGHGARSSIAKAIRMSVLAMLVIGTLSSVVTYFFAGDIAALIGGPTFYLAADFLTVLAPMPIILAASIAMAHIVMVGLGWFSPLRRIYWIMAALSLISTPIAVYAWGGDGAAWVWLGVEVLGVIIMINTTRRVAPGFLRALVIP